MIIKAAWIFILDISLHFFPLKYICLVLLGFFSFLFSPWFPPLQSQKNCQTGRHPGSQQLDAGCSLEAAALQPVGSPASQRRSAKSIQQGEEAPRGWLMAGRSWATCCSSHIHKVPWQGLSCCSWHNECHPFFSPEGEFLLFTAHWL